MAKTLSYVFAVLSRAWLFPLYWASGFVHRRDTLWVFGSWGGYRYADNAAAFFEYCHDALDDDVDLVWISRRREIVRTLRAQGRTAHWWWSPAAIATCLRAGVYLFDCFDKDINHWLSRGARRISLWSGVPLKTFERDIDNTSNRYFRLFHGSRAERFAFGAMMPWHVVRPDLIIATSEETAAITRRAFDVDADRVAVTGFPRNDVLLKAPVIQLHWPQALIDKVRSGRRIFLYLPTFRDSGRSSMQVDWGALNVQFRELDAHLCYKFHPMDPGQVDGAWSNIAGLPQDMDLYDLLPHADVLISDYSSIIFDYMLLDRPILYYVPDLDGFRASERSLNFDPEDIAVGPVCRTFGELQDAIRNVGSPADSDRRERVMPRLHAYTDSGSSQRVLDAISAHCLSDSLARRLKTRTRFAASSG